MAKEKTQLEKPVWLKTSEEDLKKIIAELSEKYSSAQIGLILRDQYGIPTVKLYGKKMSDYLKEIGKLNENAEFENAEKKVSKIEEHLQSNPQDKKTKHKLQKARSKLESARKNLAKK